MNLVPILGTTKARIGTFSLSVVAHIMAFLSDWEGQLLKRIRIFPPERFRPRCPTSRKDVWALSALHLDSCNLTGESTLFSYFPRNHYDIYTSGSPSPFVRYFVLTSYRTNSAWNRQIDEFDGACTQWKSADWSVLTQFYSMILKAYLYVKKTVANQFNSSLFWPFCLDFV